MSELYVDQINVDFGEKIHIRSVVKPQCDEEITFTIRNAKYELIDEDGIIEIKGECDINGHEIDALIQPKRTGNYTFKYIYEVADEIWIDPIKVRVR